MGVRPPPGPCDLRRDRQSRIVAAFGPYGIRKMSSQQTGDERELAMLLVDSLKLEGVAPESIAPDAPLFNEGLGLDSIDALELALAIGKKYGVQLKSGDEESRSAFASLRALSAHVQSHRPQ